MAIVGGYLRLGDCIRTLPGHIKLRWGLVLAVGLKLTVIMRETTQLLIASLRVEDFVPSFLCWSRLLSLRIQQLLSSDKDEMPLYMVRALKKYFKRTRKFQPACTHLFDSTGRVM